MDCDIKLTNIIEWIIAISLGIFGWFIAIRSTLSQQKKERYNNLIQDFHSFLYDFRFIFLQDLITKNKNKYCIQNVNRQIKYIYFKAQNLDALTNNEKIFEKVKSAGEEFTDSALLDPDIENALISIERNEQVDIQERNFLQFADKFVESCYSLTKFNIK